MKKILLIIFTLLSLSLWSLDYYDTIIPLGFSKDGNFTYLRFKNGDAISFWSLNVKSLVTDELLYYNDWDSNGYRYDQSDFNTVLSEEADLISSIFLKYSIEGSISLNISTFPLLNKNSEFNVSLLREEGEIDEYLQTMGLKKSKVKVVVTKDSGEKIIGSFEEHMESTVFGYIKSPYEERIAVLILRPSIGFEGSKAHTYLIFGSSLDHGFKE